MDTVVTIHQQLRWCGQEKGLQDDKETKRWRKEARGEMHILDF